MRKSPTLRLRDKSAADSHPLPSASPGPREAAPPATHEVFVGRQPIFDRQLTVVAYELLFRSSEVNEAGPLEPYQATAQVLLNTFLGIGLDTLAPL